MGQVAFGSYRISKKSDEHKKALTKALELGCALIDTSSNYTNGSSEELIGDVLSAHPEFSPLIMTKAGYIQGSTLHALERLVADGLDVSEVVEINDNLAHSIAPLFLEHQLNQSLTRLKKEKIDFFLLHNPEYYFESKDATQDSYYARIKKAFIYLESEVKKGRITHYGISSNNFVLPLNDSKVTDLSRVLLIAKEIKATGFKVVQFPFNLIEIGALEKLGEYGEESLLELCQQNDLLTVVNRPLNAFTQNSLVRLATYENDYKDLDEAKALAHYELCLELLRGKWRENEDHLVDESDFNEVELIKQFSDLWNKLPTPDAVDQVYFSHFFPFIARVWGKDLTPAESKVFYDLYDLSMKFSRKTMTEKANSFKNQALSVGLLPEEANKNFAQMCLETYLDYGFDYVLVGMRKVEYVDQLHELF